LVVGFRCGVGQFALPIPAPDDTAFNRDSFSPPRPARHGGHHEGTDRRPPTSCAHRLRKPDPTCEPLTPSVAPRPRGERAPYPHLEASLPHVVVRRHTWGSAAPDPLEPAAGLGRRTPNEPERLPSARPGSRDPSRRCRVRCSLHTTPPPHPVACREPGPPRQRMAGRFKLSRHRTSRPGLPRDAPRGTRKMRLTDFCNRPTTRAPQGLPDSQVRSPPRFVTLAGPSARRLTPAHPRPMASGEPPGEASLDGEPPASALSQPVTARVRSGYPDCCVGRDTARSWWSFDRMLLTRCTSRPRRFQPRAEPAT